MPGVPTRQQITKFKSKRGRKKLMLSVEEKIERRLQVWVWYSLAEFLRGL